MFRATPQDGIAWITGASSGIGRATALELARRGYRVAATARRGDELDRLAEEARGQGLRINAYPGDVTDRAGMAALVESIERECGPIALAMLNVGASFRDLPNDWCGDGFRKTFEVNFTGVLNGLAPLLPRMKSRGRGHVAVMSSVAGYAGLPNAPAYSASKAALIVACESMKPQLERIGIRLQIICPGFVQTAMTEAASFPMPFMISAEEAARRICDGFQRNGFEIAFPRRMVWFLKALRFLPYWAYFGIVGQFAKRAKNV